MNNRFILTAAHCVDVATSGTAILGAHFITNPNEPNQVRVAFDTTGIRLHPGWDPSLIRNDIALVRLPSPVTLNQFITPVRLPTTAELNSDFSGELVSENLKLFSPHVIFMNHLGSYFRMGSLF